MFGREMERAQANAVVALVAVCLMAGVALTLGTQKACATYRLRVERVAAPRG